jgi:DNA-directed RNA polymerase subunit omega
VNLNLLNDAKKRVTNIPVLINMISKRVRQLNNGARPYVRPESHDVEAVDIALREIAEGKIIAEMTFASPAPSGEE